MVHDGVNGKFIIAAVACLCFECGTSFGNGEGLTIEDREPVHSMADNWQTPDHCSGCINGGGWDSMSVEEQDAAISRLPHNSVVAQYIDRQFSISDEEQTERLLNELVSNTHDGPRNALYLHLFTEICLNADGAVGEIIGRYCMIILINNPQYINILKSDGSMMDIYAQNIAEELYYDPHSELYAKLLFELNQMSEDDFVVKINHYLDHIN